MKRIGIILGALLICASGWSQSDTPKRGFYHKVELGVVPSPYFSGFSGKIQNGFQFNSHIGVGIGLGYERLSGQSLFPVSLDFNYRVMDTKLSPYIGLSGGYNFRSNRTYSYDNLSGFTGGLQVGASYKVSKHFSVLSTVGYRYIDAIHNTGYGFCGTGIAAGGCYLPAVYLGSPHNFEFKVGLVIQ